MAVVTLTWSHCRGFELRQVTGCLSQHLRLRIPRQWFGGNDFIRGLRQVLQRLYLWALHGLMFDKMLSSGVQGIRLASVVITFTGRPRRTQDGREPTPLLHFFRALQKYILMSGRGALRYAAEVGEGEAALAKRSPWCNLFAFLQNWNREVSWLGGCQPTSAAAGCRASEATLPSRQSGKTPFPLVCVRSDKGAATNLL